MSDIFREVDEDLRRDRFGKLWKRFAPYIIGVAVLIVAGTAGYRYWETRQAEQSAEAGDVLLAAIEAGNAGNHDEAVANLSGLEDAIGGYPLLARMRRATELAASGDKAAALEAFSEIAEDGSLDQTFRDLARVRAGYLAVDLEDREAVARRVEPLTDAANALRTSALEINGLAAWKAGNLAAARDWFAKILEGDDAPSDVVGRARMMQALVDAARGADPAPAPLQDQGASDAASEGDAQ